MLHKILRFGNLSLRLGKSFTTSKVSKNKLKKLYLNSKDFTEWTYNPAWVKSIIGDVNLEVHWAVLTGLKQFEATLIEQEIETIKVESEPNEPLDVKEISAQILKHCRKYVLIIDEINRGNIPAIFGELISLIEPDKREGQPEALHTVLPYSKEIFAVPPNLYILGTMNIGDRNVEAMDMALRRRFTFVNMPANPSLLRPAIEAGVNLEKLLTTLNIRIEALLDVHHQIGHAYFMNIHTLDDLIQLFAKKIIPLLKAYFFGDLNKLGMVLGKQFFHKIQPIDQHIFGDFEAAFVEELSYRKLYELKLPKEWKEIDFIRIYDNTYEA